MADGSNFSGPHPKIRNTDNFPAKSRNANDIPGTFMPSYHNSVCQAVTNG
jgi:hypothetical protein